MTALDPQPSPAFRTLGHGTVVVEGPPRVAVDPWRWRDDDRAATVLVTGEAIDRCSEEDVLAAGGGEARVLCPEPLAARLGRAFPGRVTGVRAGGSWSGGGVVARALPARPVPRARGFLAPDTSVTWFVECAGARWLFLGASDALPEHEGLAPDVAFFAVGDFTMPTPDEAAAAAARVRPALAVPTHWGDLSARFDAARRFAELAGERGIRAVAVRGVRDAGPPRD